MATWRLAKSLNRLRSQLNTLYPNRSKVSDGSIGDAAHSARTSDHNPDSQGVVCAIDVTHDPAGGVDGQTLADQLIKDSRVKYVIFNSQIWKARTKKWEAYHGANAHRHHVHISVQQASKDNVGDWPVSKPSVFVEPAPETAPQVIPLPSKPTEAAVTTVASQPPVIEVKSQGTSLATKIASASAPVATMVSAAGLKLGGVEFKTGGLIAFAIVIVVALIVAAVLYDRGQQRAQERLRMSVDNMADPNRRNVVTGAQ